MFGWAKEASGNEDCTYQRSEYILVIGDVLERVTIAVTPMSVMQNMTHELEVVEPPALGRARAQVASRNKFDATRRVSTRRLPASRRHDVLLPI